MVKLDGEFERLAMLVAADETAFDAVVDTADVTADETAVDAADEAATLDGEVLTVELLRARILLAAASAAIMTMA